MSEITIDNITIKPLTSSLWDDFEKLFGPNGAYGGCWCMWWRLTRREFEDGHGEGNRMAMKAIVDSGEIPGLLAYAGIEPCGWCSVAPREKFSGLERSRVLKRIDDMEVWSVVCFYIHKSYRGKNIGEKLLRGVIEYVRQNQGKIIEAYPTSRRYEKLSPVTSYMGLPKIYEKVGFKEAGRPSPAKIVMRYSLEKK